MNNSRKQIIEYLQTTLQFVWGICFLLFPLFLLTATTDSYGMPKQLLVLIVALVSLLVIGTHSIMSKKILLRKTFLDLPIFTFVLAILLSALFSISTTDSYVIGIMYVILGISYFAIVNAAKTKETIFFFTASLITSGCVLALVHILSYFKVYVLPFSFTHVQTFTPLGDLLEHGIYLGAIAMITLYFAYPIVKGKANEKTILFSLASLLILADIGFVIYELIKMNPLIVLPFATGFQIAFATISQDTTRIAQSFFLGSGIGTFFIDFTRFRPTSLNVNPNLWFLNFYQSSSFVLDLLSTTGILGLLSFLFIAIKALSKPLSVSYNPFYLSLILLVILGFIFPFSFTIVGLFFFILSLFVAEEGIKNPTKSFDLELFLVTLQRGLFNADHKGQTAKTSQMMPIFFTVVLLAVVSVIGYYTTIYTLADITFNRSLVAASQNNATQTYQKQIQAITTFPYRDSFYRTFSQTNISIANSVLTVNTQKNQKPSQQVQSTVIGLIQQAITAAKTATTLSPYNAINWQNLASIYRAIIGFGQGSDNFAISSMQQAITLDPNNPQEYMVLGGLYFQLKQYDNAIKEFQMDVTLKTDDANGYYNLGHVYEAKGDLQNAMTQYQLVKQLEVNNPKNLDQITKEITALQAKLNNSGTSTTTGQTQGQIKPTQSSTNQSLSLPLSPTPTQ